MSVRKTHEAKRTKEVRFMVDSGAVYSLVPKDVLSSIGCKPYKELSFTLADGTSISRKVGDAFFEYEGNMGSAPVIFGEEGDEPLLGATTLEALGLVLNPFTRTLHPMRMLMM